MFSLRSHGRGPTLAFMVALAATAPTMAQDTSAETSASTASPSLSLELNRAIATDNGCRLGFVTTNKMGADLSKAAFEIVLFNPKGLIERLLVLDFGAMPDGRTKVREFNLSGSPCDSIDRVLVNGVSACEGDGVSKEACALAIQASSRADIEFGL
ncbi:MAG: hypothetical protein KAG89_09085 [Fulvimarina manganoxydans]|uniref:hypothetical protein n=1 Tax=Fulvimarina manganoxydans TaxID=937218 RepID=UPI0023523112|nr:hypothetical protein [Fulvimarina manganoxydans]MCK5932305.1 hypothetical protein [Fulvimarina manganoxydans]